MIAYGFEPHTSWSRNRHVTLSLLTYNNIMILKQIRCCLSVCEVIDIFNFIHSLFNKYTKNPNAGIFQTSRDKSML